MRRGMSLLWKVQDPWYTFIENGEKSIEGRLFKGSYERIKPGDIVTISCQQEMEKSIKVEIIKIERYESFKDMLENVDISKILPTIENVSEGVNVYRKFYDEQQEKKYGVIAIYLQRI